MSEIPERTELEQKLYELCQAGELQAAATLCVQEYGPELLGYLHALAPASSDGDELFGELCERLWVNLGKFRWESSVRTWAYAIARNLLRSGYRARRGPAGRVDPLRDSAAEKLADAVRTTTAAYLKTESKDRLSRIRDALDPDDRTLLILRVDRKLAWQDIARVMAEGDLTPEDLKRTSASLRKRFERVKERLRKMMNEDPSP